MKHNLFFGFVVALLTLNLSCSKSKSDFQMPVLTSGGNNGNSFSKPTCGFKPVNNCWQESIKVLQKITLGWGSDGHFVKSKEFCSNEFKDLKVQFDRPADFFDKKIPDLLFYPITGESAEAFHFKGSVDNFVIYDIVGHPGRTIHFMRDNGGNVLVRCMNGEEMNVPALAYANGGCSNHNFNALPGVYIKSDFNKEIEFGFLGIPDKAKLFKCVTP